MTISKVTELLNSYLASSDESFLTKLNEALLECNSDDESTRSKINDQCKEEFGDNLWNYLEDNTRELIIGSFADIDHQKEHNLNASSSFSNIASSLESELKSKIFNDFNAYLKKRIDKYSDDYDRQYLEALNSDEGFVPAAMMVRKLKYMKNPKGISKDLRNFLEGCWNIYSLSDDDKINDAFSLIKIRNDNADGTINKQYDEWSNTEKLTIKVLRWFIFSCDCFD